MSRHDEATEMAKRLVDEVERDAEVVGPRLFSGHDDEMARVTRATLLAHVREMWGERSFRAWLRRTFGDEAFVEMAKQAGVGYEAPRAVAPIPGAEQAPAPVEPMMAAGTEPMAAALPMERIGAGNAPVSMPAVPGSAVPEYGVEVAQLRDELGEVKALLMQLLAGQGGPTLGSPPAAIIGGQMGATPAFAGEPAPNTLDGPYQVDEAV